jgi:hypothetical protein
MLNFPYLEARKMSNPDTSTTERSVLFYVFVVLFVVIVAATLLTIFFGFGHLTPVERNVLFSAFVVEIGAAVVALFYVVFGLRRDAEDAKIRLKHDDIRALIGKDAVLTPIESSGNNLSTVTFKVLNDNGPYVPFRLPAKTHSVYITVKEGQKSYSGSFRVGTYLVDMQTMQTQ